VVSRHSATLRHVVQALGVAGLSSRQAIGPSFLPRSQPRELEVVILDLDIDSQAAPVELCESVAQACPETAIVVLAGLNARQRLAQSLAHPGVAGIMPKLGTWTEPATATLVADGPDEQSLGVALRRRVERAENALGPEPYLLAGAPVRERVVGGSTDKDDALQELVADAQRYGLSDEKLRRIEVAADELLLNAIYDAPRDEAGKLLYADVDRMTPVTLGPQAQVRVRWGYDGRTLAVSVRDGFGALAQPSVAAAVARLLDARSPRLGRATTAARAGSDGLGLVLAFSAATQLVVHVAPGRFTEVTAALHVAGSNRDAISRGCALHLFY
jgi:hypothetical protein